MAIAVAQVRVAALNLESAKVSHSLARIFAILALPLLAACATPAKQKAPEAVPGYEGVQDGEFFIEPVPAQYLYDGNRRTEVAYAGSESPGTVVVDTFARKLYLVGEGGTATRYPIAVGREGLAFRGNGVVGRKSEWPSWQPTANMVRTRPDLYAAYAGGLPGGLQNPLGRAGAVSVSRRAGHDVPDPRHLGRGVDRACHERGLHSSVQPGCH
jgi:lipoprotein-anchoring transpeptidase ErfK/SrfK